MAIVLTDDDFVTLDESSGLQNTDVPETNEDNDDDDIAFASLNASFSNRLFGVGELNLDSAFAAANGVAENDFISLTNGSVLSGFVDGSGDPLLAYDVGVTSPTTGIEVSFTTLDGEKIYLFADVAGGLGDFMVLGVDENGDIIFAGHLEADGTISLVQMEAISNPNSTDHDDAVDLSGLLGVAATSSLDFDFNDLPSGQNLFGMVGESATDPAIVVFGRDVDYDPDDGTFTNTSDTINTSKGGGPTTIGVNNQMFDPGDGAYFVYVNDPDADFLSGVPDGLDQNEADDADNIVYGDTLDVSSAFLVISQTQGNELASLSLTTYLGDDDQGRDLVDDPDSGTAPVEITLVRVTVGTDVFEFEDNDDGPQAGIDVDFGTGIVTVSGLDAGYKVEWVTDGLHNRVLVEGVSGKFDIGGFGISETTTAFEPVGDRMIFEDDGPAIVASTDPPPALVVDDSDFATDATADFSGLFTADFGTDDEAAVDSIVYALGVSAPDADSGLVDTLTEEAVLLNLDVSGDVVGTTATTDLEVFRISVDADGMVTLDQSRAVVHDLASDPVETGAEAEGLASADLVTLTATATDGDADTAAATKDIGDAFKFEDDGPSIDPSGDTTPPLVVDDSDFTTDATADFSGLFDALFGADGEAAVDSIVYALGVSAPDADSGLVDTLTGEAVLLNLDVSGDVVGTTATTEVEVFRISVDATGMVTLDQSRAVVHDLASDPIETGAEAEGLASADLVTLTATATDGDGDTDDATVDIGDAFKFEDDGPSIEPTAAVAPELVTDDSDISDTAGPVSFAGLFAADFGADGEAAVGSLTYALSVSGPDADSGLVDTLSGEAVLLNLDVSGDIVGTTETGLDEVFRISVDPDTGGVTLVQSRAILHDDPLDPEEDTSPAVMTLAGLVQLTATATDGDGDTDSATIDITASFKFEDDGPTIGPISDGVVDFAVGEDVSNFLGADAGNDGASASITDFTASFDFGFGTLIGVLSNDEKSVTYYDDEDGSGIIEAGETNAYFTLAIDDSDADSANWNYTFTVLRDPEAVALEFDFDELPSGANLFGVVGESATDPAIIVVGRDPDLDGDGKYTNTSDVIHTSQGGTGATIGVNNQMFDPGDGAYFSYVDDPVADFLSGVPGGLTQTEADDGDNIQYGDTLDVSSAFLVISQVQGNSLVEMDITTFLQPAATQGTDFIDSLGDGTSPLITMVRVYDENGTLIEETGGLDDATVEVTLDGATASVSGLDDGYKIEWVTDTLHNQVLVEGVEGKFDVGAFGISQPQPTPDAELDFEVTIEDFDGDTNVADFTIGVDGDLDGFITP